MQFVALFCALFSGALAFANSCVNPSNSRYVILGDSHATGAFGEALERTLGSGTIRYAAGGAGFVHWASRENMQKLSEGKKKQQFTCPGTSSNYGMPDNFPTFEQIAAANPKATYILALGTNDALLGCRASHAYRKQMFDSMISRMPSGASCAWVSPPTMVKDGTLDKTCGQSYYDFLDDWFKFAAESRRCGVINSEYIGIPSQQNGDFLRGCFSSPGTQILPDGGGSHMHFAPPTARYWGQCAGVGILDALSGSSRLAGDGTFKITDPQRFSY